MTTTLTIFTAGCHGLHVEFSIAEMGRRHASRGVRPDFEFTMSGVGPDLAYVGPDLAFALYGK